MKRIAEQGGKVIITTDHGTINVKKPSRVIGDRNVNANLRYKQGKNLDYQESDVFAVNKPEDIFLPKQNISTKYKIVIAVTIYIYISGNIYIYIALNYRFALTKKSSN